MCQKQRDFYKKNENLLISLCNKYQLNYELITLEKIEESLKLSFHIKSPSDVINDVITLDPIKDVVAAEPESIIEEEESIEVEDLEYNGKIYYVDNNKNIYNRLENDDIGEIIGIVDIKGKVKLNKKR